MSELADARAQLRLNEAKIAALKLFASQFEKNLLALVESLARQGYTKDEIIQAIEAARPNFEEGARTALRSITIMDLMASANDG
jgi:hypothetical protein